MSCPSCNDTGAVEGRGACPECEGLCVIWENGLGRECPDCEGAGWISWIECQDCDGIPVETARSSLKRFA